MANEKEKIERIKLIENYLKLIKYKKLEFEDNLNIIISIYSLLLEHYYCNKGLPNNLETQSWVGKIAINYLIPSLEFLIKSSPEAISIKAFRIYKQVYALAGRTSLEHFINYMEWDNEKKVLVNCIGVLKPFLFYLNKSMFDEKLRYIIASYPPGFGKSFSATFYIAWAFGRDKDGSILRMSYSEDLVLSFSRSVQDIMEDPKFSEVFPFYKELGEKKFDTVKASDWKIRQSSGLTSLYSRSRDGAITGVRAKTSIVFDDMVKNYQEGLNSDLLNKMYTDWKTAWINRKEGQKTKYIFLGTMWSPEDILNRVKEDREKISKLVPSKIFKYVWETEDGSTAIIQVPLLDENDNSTCEFVTSTQEAIELRDTTEPFEYSCVYQQDPIAPTGREFADENLEHYEKLPKNEDGTPAYSNCAFAVLDPARKGKDNVSMPICIRENGTDNYYLIDVIFQKKAMTELYNEIVDKIIQHEITEFCVENNTDTSLKTLLEEKLKQREYTLCTINEKYNVEKKEQRIKDQRGNIIRHIIFKEKNKYNKNSDYGRFMENLNKFSFDYTNKHDDAPDSLALFVNQIIREKGKIPKAKAISRKYTGI